MAKFPYMRFYREVNSDWWFYIVANLLGVAENLINLVSLGHVAAFWDIEFSFWYQEYRNRRSGNG